MQLTQDEKQALLELVVYKCEDALIFMEESEDEEAVRHGQELAFWQAIEQKLVNA